MTRAALYLRQSQDRSGKEEGIERQRSRCAALAELRGWEVVEEYVDNDTSATKPRGVGTAWHKLMIDAQANRIEVIVAVDMDRLLRTLRDLVGLIDLGLKVVTVDGEIDLTSADGTFRATMTTALARFEGQRKSERQKRANSDRRDKGVPTPGRVPYGYLWVPTKERDTRGNPSAYDIDEERANDVRAMYESFLAGVALGSICRDLNTAGKRTIPSKSNPEGVRFRPTTLRRILLSPYYAALLPLPSEDGGAYDQGAISRDNCVDGNWPAIVTPEEWQEAKGRLEHPERRTSPGPSRKWLLSGLATCGVCGEAIRAGGGEAGIHSYRCRSMAHFMRRGVPLDDFIERVIVARLSRPDAVDLLTKHERGDVEALRVERRRLELAVRQAGDDEQDGLIGRPERVRLTKRANARIAKIDDDLKRGVDVDALGAVVGQVDVSAAWNALTLGHKRAILEALMTVVVHSVGQGNRRVLSDEAMAKTIEIVWHEPSRSAL